MRGNAEIIIDRPIAAVWDVVADVESMARWVDGISELRLTSSGPARAGSTVASKYTYRNRTFDLTYEVTEFQPPNRQAIRSTSGPFPFSSAIELESSQAGTRVVNTIDAGSDSKATTVIFALVGPFIRMMMNRQLKKELSLLKSLVEGESLQATAPPAPPAAVVPEAGVTETGTAGDIAPAATATGTPRKPTTSRAKSPGAATPKATTTAAARKPRTATSKRAASTNKQTRTRKAPPKEDV